MEAALGLVIVVVIVLILLRPIFLTTSEANKQAAANLLDTWAHEHQYSLLHKSFVGREWYSSKRLRYEIYAKDMEGKQRTGMATCFIFGEGAAHNRVEVSWGIDVAKWPMNFHK